MDLSKLSPEARAEVERAELESARRRAEAKKERDEWLEKWTGRIKGPVLWIVIGVALAMMGRFIHAVDQVLLMVDALALVAVVIGGLLLILNVGYGRRNALGEFVELMERCMERVRNGQPLDALEVQLLKALAIRNVGTLLFAAIITLGVLTFLEKSSAGFSKPPPDTEEQALAE